MSTFNFGYVSDNDPSLRSKSGGSFGLNGPVFFTKLEFNPNAGKDGAAADAVDISLKVGERDFNARVYNAETLYENGEEMTPGTPEFQKAYETEMNQRLATVTHFIKATGVTDAQIQAAMSAPISDFAGWAKTMCAMVSPGHFNNPVDIFLEYQWSIKSDNDKTYLQLPKNMKGGHFAVAHVAPVGQWKEDRTGGSLCYKDDAGKEHPFTRSENYMDSPKANQQKEGEDNSSPASGAAIAGGTAVPATW